MDLETLRQSDVTALTDEQLREALGSIVTAAEEDRKENQLLYYKPVSESARRVHYSRANMLGIGGGNRSSKTSTALVDLCALATGIYPLGLEDAFRDRFIGPRRVRVVCESLTTVLHPTILPKLKWWNWSGIDRAGGERGHWGFIPKDCLIGGNWDKSWSEKLRTLTVLCRNPENHDEVLGESLFQFMSVDQDPSDFASGSFHDVLHDEPPTYAIWREDRMRVLDVNGRVMVAMTWPDDPSIPIDWLFDEIYEPAKENKPGVEWFELHTTENQFLDQVKIAEQTAGMSLEQRQVRIYGQPIRFSNRIHPLFTDTPRLWCFKCGRETMLADGACMTCGAKDCAEYCHVTEFDIRRSWPCIYVLDPHPRRPHMMGWVQVDPSDDLWLVAHAEVPGDVDDVKRKVDDIESSLGLNIAARIMDPNMGASPASSKRDITWQDEFRSAGLACDLANDSEVGRSRVNEYLKPDKDRRQPRLHFHARCGEPAHQMKRYVWDEHRRKDERDAKQIPKDKYSDYPSLLKYALNFDPVFRFLHHGAPIIARAGKRRGAY